MEEFHNYLHDMRLVQVYLYIIKTMVDEIITNMGFDIESSLLHTLYNLNDMILRKGAISAYKDEKYYSINRGMGACFVLGKEIVTGIIQPHMEPGVVKKGQIDNSLDEFKEYDWCIITILSSK